MSPVSGVVVIPCQDLDECLWRLREDLSCYRTMAEALVERLQDQDPVVVSRAMAAVVKARESSSLESLGALVAEAPEELAASAQGALARVGVPARVARLLREWRFLKEPPSGG